MVLAEGIIAAVVALLVVIIVLRSVRIVPQARARNVERFGRYRKTLEPGMNFILPVVDRVKKEIDLREQVVSFTGSPVITEDNVGVLIDTVLFFQVTDPRAADYEIVSYHPGDRAAHRHDAAQRDRVDGPGADPDLARQDQQRAPWRAR